MRKFLQQSQQEVQAAEAAAKTAASEAKTSQDRANDAEARAEAARAKSEKALLAAESETRMEEVTDKESEFARKAYKDAERRSLESERRKNEAKLKLHEEKKSRSAAAANEATDLHVAALSAKLEARTALKEAEKKARKQAQRAAAARRQADQFSAIKEQLEDHAEEEKEAATMRRIAWENAEANFRRTESELASTKTQLEEALKSAQVSKESVVKNREHARQLVNESSEAKTSRKLKLENLRAAIENKDLAQEAFDAAQEVAEKKKNDLADVRKAHAKAVAKHQAAQRELNEQKYKDKKHQKSLCSAMKARDRATNRRQLATQAKEAAEKANLRAAELAAYEHYAFQYKEKKEKVLPVSQALCKMTLLNGCKFKVFENSLVEPYCNMHSMPLKKAVELYRRRPESWKNFLDFTKNHLLRIFGSEGEKINPVFPWALGCQLVSVRSDDGKPDFESWINNGRFRENGSSGYVLKPRLRSRSGIRGALCRLNVRVLSGNRLPAPATNKYKSAKLKVMVSLYDVAPRSTTGTVTTTSSHTTKAVSGNRLNPVWDEPQEKCASFEIFNSDVAMLLFTVWDGRDVVGVSSIPFSCLREGYRSVQLFDENFTRCGVYSFASLFVHISTN